MVGPRIVEAALHEAAMGQADYVVTGDVALLALGWYERVHIVAPRPFLALLDADAG